MDNFRSRAGRRRGMSGTFCSYNMRPCAIAAGPPALPPPPGAGRFGAQLVDRRHVDAQHVHDALGRIGRRAAPVGAALRARNRHRVFQRRRREEPVVARVRDARLPRVALLGRQDVRIDVVGREALRRERRRRSSETAGSATRPRPESRSAGRGALRSATAAPPSRDRTHTGIRSCPPARRRRCVLPFRRTVVNCGAATLS